MKVKRAKTKIAAMLGAAVIVALGGACIALSADTAAYADGGGDYGQSYRNQLAYSPKNGWNNDPNGLLYVPDSQGGVYHMYYQYNWDKSANGGQGATENVWGHMSWGHATSRDLVHWEEQPVALCENTVGDDHQNYGMMFSGSAVYDERNTSGLFETSGGKAVEGQGIVALLTQPDEGAGGQRQILAYSKDNGQSFSVYGEVLSAGDGKLGDGEFRDPKVFWSEEHSKWLMAVGGGSVRMYSSDNLKNWDYLGETGYWGECPDISRYEADGEEKYVLIISPEDKAKSHEYNKTTRADTYYPAEYYVVGDLNEKGLFVSDEALTRLSEGIDSYAFQSFNNTPDGNVYGVSWSASWKTVDAYRDYRQSYNGGMTITSEMRLVKEDGAYKLLRRPVEAYDGLRGDKVAEFNGTLKAGENAFEGVFVREADIEAELDFSGGDATYVQLNLRESGAERTVIGYDTKSKTLTFDRSQSSLLAKDTPLYKEKYVKKVEPVGGKLNLRIIVDRAFVSVFANGGEASCFSAIFPSAISNGISLVSDGALNVKSRIYGVNGIFGNAAAEDKVVLTTNKIDTVVGRAETVIASSFGDGFDPADVSFTMAEGGENIRLEAQGAVARLTPLRKGYAKLCAEYKDEKQYTEFFIYNDAYFGDVNYNNRLGGFSFLSDDGINFETGKSDAFLFGDKSGEDLTYSAVFTRRNSEAQAGGLVFGISGNKTDYFVATADFKDNKVKLWRSGIGDIKVADCELSGKNSVQLAVKTTGENAEIYIDGARILSAELNGYKGGGLGLNVYNGAFAVNFVSTGERLKKVINVTDGSRQLSENDYTVKDGEVKVANAYLSTLENDREYVFRAVTTLRDYEFKIKTHFAVAQMSALKEDFSKGEEVVLALTDGIELYKIEIDGREVEFALNSYYATISADALSDFTGGSHTVKAYTSMGRPTVSVNILSPEDFREEEIEIISHTFFYIDMAIFGTAIAAYAAFTVFKKVRKAKRKAA